MNVTLKRALLPLLLVGAVVAGFFFQRTMEPSEIEGFLWPAPEQLAAFELVDHKEQPFDLSNIQGRWTLWYFGYTHCPDACPTALTTMRGVEGALRQSAGTAADDMQYLFVSVDPTRDTPSHLSGYVEFFSNSLVGATGNDEQLKSLSRQLGVLYVLGEPDEHGEYLVDHSTFFFLTDPHGRWVGLFRPEESTPEDLAERVRAIRRAVDSA